MTAIRDGDTDAWHRLVRIYGPLLIQWCRRCGLQESDACDVSQEVLVGLNKSLDRFEHRQGGGSFRAWLWSITKNKIADHHRQHSSAPTAGGGTGALRQMLSLPDKSPESSEDIADLHLRTLEELRLSFSPSTWTAFWRVCVEGDAAKDVAEDLGTTVWAVYKARSRILAKLRQQYGEAFQ